jgi:hypothetical protein
MQSVVIGLGHLKLIIRWNSSAHMVLSFCDTERHEYTKKERKKERKKEGRVGHHEYREPHTSCVSDTKVFCLADEEC